MGSNDEQKPTEVSRIQLMKQAFAALESLGADTRSFAERTAEIDQKNKEWRARALAANGLTEEDVPDIPLISGDE